MRTSLTLLCAFATSWSYSTNTVSVTNTTATLKDLSPGTYYAAVTAHDTNGVSSDFSDEVSFTVPNKPTGARISVVVNVAVEISR